MNAAQFLDSCLPLPKLAADLDAVLSADGRGIEIDGAEIPIPPNTKVELVVRVARAYEFNIGLGALSAVLAIGGVKIIRHGVAEPGICFATLWYSAEGEFITADFHVGMR